MNTSDYLQDVQPPTKGDSSFPFNALSVLIVIVLFGVILQQWRAIVISRGHLESEQRTIRWMMQDIVDLEKEIEQLRRNEQGEIVLPRPQKKNQLDDPIDEIQPLTESEFEKLKAYLREHPEAGRISPNSTKEPSVKFSVDPANLKEVPQSQFNEHKSAK